MDSEFIDAVQQDLDAWVACFSKLTSVDPELKLPEEVAEFLAAPASTRARLQEAADVSIVLLTQLTYEGFNLDELLRAVQEKLVTNVGRKWRLDSDGIAHHIKG